MIPIFHSNSMIVKQVFRSRSDEEEVRIYHMSISCVAVCQGRIVYESKACNTACSCNVSVINELKNSEQVFP